MATQCTFNNGSRLLRTEGLAFKPGSAQICAILRQFEIRLLHVENKSKSITGMAFSVLTVRMSSDCLTTFLRMQTKPFFFWTVSFLLSTETQEKYIPSTSFWETFW